MLSDHGGGGAGSDRLSDDSSKDGMMAGGGGGVSDSHPETLTDPEFSDNQMITSSPPQSGDEFHHHKHGKDGKEKVSNEVFSELVVCEMPPAAIFPRRNFLYLQPSLSDVERER